MSPNLRDASAQRGAPLLKIYKDLQQIAKAFIPDPTQPGIFPGINSA